MTSRLQIGHVVAGRYEVLALIGEGPMGEVYRARDQASGSTYALKLFRPEVAGTPAWASFLHEAQRIADVPGVLRVWDAGVEASTASPFVLTALGEGASLASEVSANGPLTPERAAIVVKGVASIVSSLHGVSAVHRGLVPSNIFINGVTVTLSDFGVASLRAAVPPPSGPIAYGWAPVELAQGAPPAPTMDVWSLGALLFFALTGKSPFLALGSGSFDASRLWAEMNTELPAASARARELGVPLAPSLDVFFGRALAVAPSARFATVAEALDVLAKATARKGTGTVMLGAVDVAAQMAAHGLPAQNAAPAPMASVAPAPVPANYDDEPPPKKKSAAPLILGIVFGLLAIGGIVAVLFVFAKKPVEAPNAEPAGTAAASSDPAPTPPTSATASAPEPAASAPPPASTASRVTITCSPDCEELTCDGKPVDGGVVELLPGKHKCVGKKKDHQPQTDAFATKAGEDLTRTLTLTKNPDKATAPAGPPKKKCTGVFIKDCK